MKNKKYVTLDGNEACAYVAYRVNEVCAIYPITPSSSMAELADEWASRKIKNIWGAVPSVFEMQSEGGAAGAIHGALQLGALTTTFTASQGLLLMLPNMFKIAGELTPSVFHVSARSVATHALSIFGDHSDVMIARGTGFALLASASVQEAMDMALIAQASTLESRIPFLHFFDGFRTSHEMSKVELIEEDVMRKMIDNKSVRQHRQRALSPDHPFIRGTAQNPDVFFQNREACNPYFNACAEIVQNKMDQFAELTGRAYHLFDYYGAANAERIIVSMASSIETIRETVNHLNVKGEKVGLVVVRLYRPFDVKRLVEVLPESTKSIAVLDRTKEPCSPGEPLYLDVSHALMETQLENPKFKVMPKVVGGRYGLSSKEFTPAMVVGIFDNLKEKKCKNHFTVGIKDDVTHTSLDYDPTLSIESDKVVRAIFYGLGADGTVGANKNSIKIIGENTSNHAQGYFVYDSKKSGSMTISHLRFGPEPIHAPYLITRANFIACHQPFFMEKINVVQHLAPGGTFLLNSTWAPEEVWYHLPQEIQEILIDRKAKIYTIDGQKVAKECGMGRRINTIMQVCFFAISNVLPKEEAIEQIKESIRKTYGKKGSLIVDTNLKAVDNTLEHLYKVEIPDKANSKTKLAAAVPDSSPDFVKDVLSHIIAGRGDDLPVSAFPVDGTYPSDTAQYEKRNISLQIPVWEEDLCIQCGKCVLQCPHAVIRSNVFDASLAKDAPTTFKQTVSRDTQWKEKGMMYSIQVSPEDCTGCSVCVEACPVKDKSNISRKAVNMAPITPLREQEKENWAFFNRLPDLNRNEISITSIGQQQNMRPLFEFSGACSGCGETPYLKLLSQLYGDRAVIANATGCSSIYGGNLPTTPWAKNSEGRGPAWANSLFEDNAEFGLGFRLALTQLNQQAIENLKQLEDVVGSKLMQDILDADQKDEMGINAQRDRVEQLKTILKSREDDLSQLLLSIADNLVKKSVWIVGGDGWAYDIGYGGLDHVLASGKNVNILVLDTEVYSNTGGQMSKSTPIGAVAKFAAGGKPGKKKDLGIMAMSYGNVYVAKVAMGAKDLQTLKAFLEAEQHDGPSLIIAYSHCIAHGINMEAPLQHQKALIDSGQWVLYRNNPNNVSEGKNPLTIDSQPKKVTVEQYMNLENRFKMLWKTHPEDAKKYYAYAKQAAKEQYEDLQYLAGRKMNGEEEIKSEKNEKPK
ncbi:MAG: pyruvate:ferredoxin (flavodoxin) oxidoreductase [Cyclobacteriaceae bacterium]|nr:pyruvate:ferredoxin (flavodoxin) oxidoreductase [Cyclobacteriaceae bacterium]